VVLHTDMVQRAFSFTVKLIGDQGTLLWRRDDHRFDLYTAADRRWRHFDETPPVVKDLGALKPGWEWVEPVYFMDTRQFVDRLHAGDPATASFESGMHNLRIILAALERGHAGHGID
jgi:hypothetical protein